MKDMGTMNRRDFLRTVGAGAAGLGALTLGGSLAGRPARAAAAEAADPYRGLKVGLASYSANKLSLDQLIALMKDLGLRYVTLKDCHLKMTLSKEQIQAEVKKLKDAGLVLMGGGVIYLKSDEAQARPAFEYARAAGMPVMVSSFDPDALPTVEKLAKEYDQRVAIHNHGPGDKHFPSAVGVYDQIKDLDPHVGVCIDIGHTVRLGENEVESVRKIKTRLYDFHLKDLHKVAEGKFEPAILGTGVIHLKEVMNELADMKYAGHVALEYEKQGPNLAADLKACYAGLRKLMAS